MKLAVYILAIAMCCSVYSVGQNHDNTWLFGDHVFQTGAANQFSFTNNVLAIDTADTDANFYITNASISNPFGELEVYTNGLRLYNSQFEVIENGDSINYGWLWDNNFLENSNSIDQGALLLPDFNDGNDYHLFHLRGDAISSPDTMPSGFLGINDLLYTHIIQEDDSFRIEVKNEILIDDTMFAGQLTACKHANGEDWWVMASEGKSNCVYVILFTSQGFESIDKQCAGPIDRNIGQVGYAKFTNDGEMFVKASSSSGVGIYDFDRWTGQLDLVEQIGRISLFDTLVDPFFYYQGVISISPNSRFLYTSAGDSTFRFELQSQNIVQTKELVHAVPFDSLPFYTLFRSELAPDGKLYYTNSTSMEYHVINNPDALIDNIGLELKKPIPQPGGRAFPNNVNYRLGPCTTNPCDTVNTIRNISRIPITVYPNPSRHMINVNYGAMQWQANSKVKLEIVSTIGQVVYSSKLPVYSAHQVIDIGSFANGLYFVNIYEKGLLIANQKISKI